MNTVTIPPHSVRLVDLRIDPRSSNIIAYHKDPDFNANEQQILVETNRQFYVDNPRIKLYNTVAANINNNPDFCIFAENRTHEPVRIKKGILMAEAQTIDPDFQKCPINSDTWQAYQAGELSLNQIVISNLQAELGEATQETERLDSNKTNIPPAPPAELAAPHMEEPPKDEIKREALMEILEQAKRDAASQQVYELPPQVREQLKVEHLQPHQQDDIIRLCSKYPNLWSKSEYDIGRCRYMDHVIQLSKSLPTGEKRRAVAKQKQLAAKEIIDQMIAADLLTPALCDFVQNCHIVMRKDGRTRLTLDSRKLNNVTIAQRTSAYTSEQFLAELAGRPFRTVLDLKNSYYHIPLAPECKHLTAFHDISQPGRVLIYERVSMGLRNGSTALINAMAALVGDLPHTLNYMDDLCCSSVSWEQHVEDLNELFSRLNAATWKCGMKKCQFGNGVIEFLGFTISDNKVSITEAKQQALSNLKPPTDKKGVVKFLAMCNYYRRFLKSFSMIAADIQRLVRKDVPFDWDAKCQRAFDTIIKMFKDNIASYLPTPDGKFHLSTDASLKGFGAILEQSGNDNVKRLVAAFSGTWTDVEAKASIFELEAIAFVRAMEHFDWYLRPLYAFYAYIDNRALVFVKRAAACNEKIHRLAMRMIGYNFDVLQVKSKLNVFADVLSRQDAAKNKIPTNLSKYQLDDVLHHVEIDVHTLVDKDKVKVLYDTNMFRTDAGIPVKEQKVKHERFLQTVSDALERVEITEGVQVNSVTIQDFLQYYPHDFQEQQYSPDILMQAVHVFEEACELQDEIGLETLSSEDESPSSPDAHLQFQPRRHERRVRFNDTVTAFQPLDAIQPEDAIGDIPPTLIRPSQPGRSILKQSSESENTDEEEFSASIIQRDLITPPLPDSESAMETDSMETTDDSPEDSAVTEPEQRSEASSSQADSFDTTGETHKDQPSFQTEDSPDPDSESNIWNLSDEEQAAKEILIPSEEEADKNRAPIYAMTADQQADVLIATIMANGYLKLSEFIELQEHDAFCELIFKGLRENKSKIRANYCLKKGVLLKFDFKIPEHYADSSPEVIRKLVKSKVRIVIPSVLIKPIVYSTHHGLAGAHAPQSRVIETVTQKYYYPGLAGMVQNIVAACRSCQLSSYSSRPLFPVGVHRAACYPRLVVSLDLAVNLPKTAEGYQHLLVMICNFSRFVCCAPLKTRSGQEILNAFRTTWLAMAGKPHVIVSDNELGLTGGPFKEFMQLYDIRHATSLPFSPMGNSFAERAVALTKGALRSFCMANDTAPVWHKYLWVVTRAVNSLVSRATGTSPELLMFGTKNLETEQEPVLFSNHHGLARDPVPSGVYRQALLACVKMVDDSRNLTRAKNLEYRNSHKMPTEFKEGQIVSKKVMTKQVAAGVPRALTKTHSGPFIITKLFTKLAEIQHCLNGHKQLSNIDYLRPWHENFYDFLLPPNWENELRQFLPSDAPHTPASLPNV